MATVKFDRVQLTGFGPYREATDFIFSDQLNVLVAPNETGKSTLVAGVNALLFGLPQTSDATVFGQARYLNWDHPLRFEGELIWRVDGDHFRLRRNFQNNQISLAQLQNGEYREIIGGTHNPRAQRRNVRYEEKLQELFGLSSQELFEATFCLTQPLPEADELDGRVQELLSGTGVGFKQATDRLTKELRGITRFTGRRGVTAKDAFDPRSLERLEAEIEATRIAIQRDRELVDQLETGRKRLGEEERRRKELVDNLAAQERMLTLWAQWQQLKKSYEAARLVYTQVQKSREQAGELDRALRRIEEERAAYSWGPMAPRQTAEILSELEAIAQQKIALEREINELETEKGGASPGDGQTDDSPLGPDWSAFGTKPLSVVEKRQSQGAEALAFWEEWEQLKQAEAENRLLRQEEYAQFEAADPTTLELLKVYGPRRAYLHSDLENATLKWENAKAEQRRNRSRRIIQLLFLICTAVLGGGIGLFWAGGRVGSYFWPLGGLFLGAILGYLAGRPLCPAGALAQIRKEIAENESQANAARQALTDFERQVRPFTEQYSDVMAASRCWERLLVEGKELARRQQDLLRRELGGFSGPVEKCPLTDTDYQLHERWYDLFAFAQIMEPTERFECLGELIRWLREKTPRWWGRLLDDVAAFEEKRAELNRVRVRQEANQAYLEKQQLKLDDLVQAEEELRRQIAMVLTAAGEDYQQARKLWSTWLELGQKAEKATESLQNIFSIQRVKTLAELEAKCDDAFLKAQTLLSERQKLVAAHPGLDQLETTADPEAIEAGYHRRREEVARAQAELKAIDEELRRLTTELARLEGQEPVNIARAEEKLAELEARHAELTLSCAALTLAYQELTIAINDFQSTYRLRLAAAITKYYQELTGVNGRQVELDDDFRVTVVIDGRPVAPAQLSYGARDQLYIALRLGIAQLLATETVLPFVFDDPFLNCDAERLTNIRASLRTLAAERQVILLSHRTTFATWGEPLKIRTVA